LHGPFFFSFSLLFLSAARESGCEKSRGPPFFFTPSAKENESGRPSPSPPPPFFPSPRKRGSSDETFASWNLKPSHPRAQERENQDRVQPLLTLPTKGRPPLCALPYPFLFRADAARTAADDRPDFSFLLSSPFLQPNGREAWPPFFFFGGTGSEGPVAPFVLRLFFSF